MSIKLINFSALRRAVQFSRKGATAGSKFKLFLVALLNQIHHRRRVKRRIIQGALRILNRFKRTLRIQINLSGKQISFCARLDNFADYQTIWECLGEMYSPELLSIQNPIEHIFDAGGNIGLFSVRWVTETNCPSSIIVEPDPGNFDLVKQNASILLGSKQFQLALSGSNGKDRFLRSSSNTGSLLNIHPEPQEFDQIIEVSTRRIVDLLPDDWNLKNTVLKLDIEGAEYEVLSDLLNFSPKRPQFIIAELHDYFGRDGQGLVENLRRSGYHVELEGSGDSGNVCRQIYCELSAVR